MKWYFFRKKMPKKFVSSEKSITFASAIERDVPKKRNFRASRMQKKILFLMLRRSRKNRLFEEKAEIAQLVEHNLAKVGVAGPSPVFRSTY